MEEEDLGALWKVRRMGFEAFGRDLMVEVKVKGRRTTKAMTV